MELASICWFDEWLIQFKTASLFLIRPAVARQGMTRYPHLGAVRTTFSPYLFVKIANLQQVCWSIQEVVAVKQERPFSQIAFLPRSQWNTGTRNRIPRHI